MTTWRHGPEDHNVNMKYCFSEKEHVRLPCPHASVQHQYRGNPKEQTEQNSH